MAHYPAGALKDREWHEGRLSPARIAAMYLVVGALWILLSDRLLVALVADSAALARLETAKGWFYVLVTAGLLYVLIRRHEAEMQQANQVLERRVEERTRELSTLLAVSRTVVSTLELEPLLDLILCELEEIVHYTGASIFILEGEDLVLQAHHGLFSKLEVSRVSLRVNRPLLREAIFNQKTTMISDTWDDTPLAADFQVWAREYAQTAPGVGLDGLLHNIRSWMGVPLAVKGRTVGLLTLSYSEPDYYSQRDARLVMAFADQAAVAIENAQLYGQASQRLAEIESLQRVTAALLQKLTLEETLDVVCREACQLTGAKGGALFSLIDEAWLEIVHSGGALKPLATRMPVEGTFTGQAILKGEPLLFNDPGQLKRSSHLVPNLDSLLVIPLHLEGSIVGALDVMNKPGGFTQDDLRILSLFADGAVIAIDSARLQQQAEQLAVVEERQRLARELHDSVTQALYSVNLYAEAARRAIEFGKREAALENLEQVRNMAREAVVDMRLLIFELRPPVLEEEGLAAALQVRLDSVETRAGLETEMQVEGRSRLPPAVEEELFWIAQEVLNNVVKHARARQVTVRLRLGEEEVRLVIQDDGVGFEPAKAGRSGGVGLRSMEERAARIGGELDIQSTVGEGTIVQVRAEVVHLGREER